jgi:hypothetical protein
MPVIAQVCHVSQLLEHTPPNHASRWRSGSEPSCARRMNSVNVKSVMKKPSVARTLSGSCAKNGRSAAL